jgi:hypothetical protein
LYASRTQATAFRWGNSRKNGHTRQHDPGAADAAETADLDEFATACAHESGLDHPGG